MNVRIPNNETRSSRATNGYLPLTEQRDDVKPPAGGDRRAGTMPLSGTASPVNVPDHRFRLSDARMPQPPSAVATGQGAVPVQPFASNGLPERAEVSIPDMARAAKPPR